MGNNGWTKARVADPKNRFYSKTISKKEKSI